MTKTYKQSEETKVDEPTLYETKFLSQLAGIVDTVTSAPTGKPTNMVNQFKIYTNGATYRFYWYDAKNDVWHYVTATA